MTVIREICDQLPVCDREPEEVEHESHRPTPLDRFLQSLGPRHRDATLENFHPPNEAAMRAISRLRRYEAHIRERVRQGTGLLIYGSSGTGKDHLLVAMAKSAIRAGHIAKRICGPELFRVMRDAMTSGEESRRLEGLKYPSLLIISDPLPPVGALTPYQASVLYEILDHRWQNRKATWCSINVSGSDEADQRLGAAIVDRLQDGAIVIKCDWPSYRKAAKE